MQPLSAYVGVVSHDAGQLPVVVVIVCLSPELVATVGLPVEAHLAVSAAHAAVGAVLTGSQLTVHQGEGIVVLPVGIFSRHGEGEAFRQPLHIAQVGTHIAERTPFHLGGEMHAAVCRNLIHRLYRQHGGTRRLSCRDEDVFVVANGELHCPHIVERIARHVYLAALTLAEEDAVVAHTRMLCTEASHRDGLHASRPTIVTQCDARQSVQGVRHIHDAKVLHLPLVDGLQGRRTHQLAVTVVTHHHHTVQMLRAERVGLCADRRLHSQGEPQRHGNESSQSVHTSLFCLISSSDAHPSSWATSPHVLILFS